MSNIINETKWENGIRIYVKGEQMFMNTVAVKLWSCATTGPKKNEKAGNSQFLGLNKNFSNSFS